MAMEEKDQEVFEKPVVDEKYVDEGEGQVLGGKDRKLSWGFYVLCGCVLFALYELLSSILFFFK